MHLVDVQYLDGDYATTGLLVDDTSWNFSIGYEDGTTETFEKTEYKHEITA
ncbi:hypothetical protein D3C73_1125370 [compost metagenome]